MFENKMSINFLAVSENQAFARVAVAAFAAQLNPTLAEIADIKTAVSEAVTNAIIHGYDGKADENFVRVECFIKDKSIFIEIIDEGLGIDDINQAREPLYTSKPEMERSGMGFTVMEEFMDELTVISLAGKGTSIKMRKEIGE